MGRRVFFAESFVDRRWIAHKITHTHTHTHTRDTVMHMQAHIEASMCTPVLSSTCTHHIVASRGEHMHTSVVEHAQTSHCLTSIKAF